MERFHVIEDAAAILSSRGVYRQAKVYRRGSELFAAHGGGFIRLCRDGTSLPHVRCVDIEVPGWEMSFDSLGRYSVRQ